MWFTIVIKIEESSIANTSFIIIRIKLLIIIIKNIIFINYICFSYGDMEWLIQIRMNCYHIKGKFSSYNISLVNFWNRQ